MTKQQNIEASVASAPFIKLFFVFFWSVTEIGIMRHSKVKGAGFIPLFVLFLVYFYIFGLKHNLWQRVLLPHQPHSIFHHFNLRQLLWTCAVVSLWCSEQTANRSDSSRCTQRELFPSIHVSVWFHLIKMK